MDDKKRKKLIKQIQPGKGYLTGGAIGAVIGSGLSERVGSDILMIILGIIGIIVGYFIIEKANSRKRKYLSCIENNRILSLDEIAAAMNVSYDTVSREIEGMINKGFFGNAFINNNTRSVVLSSTGVDINTQVTETTKKCPTCGATCKVSSIGNNKCEYCGTILD